MGEKIGKWDRDQVSDDVGGEYGSNQIAMVRELAPDDQRHNDPDQPARSDNADSRAGGKLLPDEEGAAEGTSVQERPRMGNDRTVGRVRDAAERELQRRLTLAEQARGKMEKWSEIASAEETARRLGRASDARALARARRDLERDPQLKRMLKASRRELKDQLRRRERGS